MRLHGRTIAITGAASGIGFASSERVLAEGGSVIAIDRERGALETLAKAYSEQLSIVTGDVTDAATVAHALGPLERLDGLVTAAGVSESGEQLTDISEDTWDRIFAINVKASWQWLRDAVPLMSERGGSVVFIASQLAFGGGQLNAAYIASKGAIVSLAKTAALELAPHDIRVNAVAPGAIETPMLRRSMSRAADPQGAEARSRGRHAMGRFGQPEEIAAGILYLLSPEASFTTGTTLLIDGGWTAA
ncbi:MAG: SDR family oxidoreductase [Pseudomonadota bacterium]